MLDFLYFLFELVFDAVRTVSYNIVYKILEPIVPPERQETARRASAVIAVILGLVSCFLCMMVSAFLMGGN